MVYETKRKSKTYSTSTGNKFLFNQMRKRNKVFVPKRESQEAILLCLVNNANCCSAGKHYLGCIGKKFVSQNLSGEKLNTDALLEYIQECRGVTSCKTSDEMKQFVKEVYDKAEVVQGKLKTTMNYRLPIITTCTQITMENNKVCRKGITSAYGFSVKALKSYSASKKAGTVGSFLHKAKRLSDSTVYQRSFNEVEAIFEDNVTDYTLLDNDMIRSALVPRAQQFCSVWLDNHFLIYGDKAPNKLEIQVSVNTKKEIYEVFAAEASTNDIKPVGYNTFVNLWNAQFPNVIARPWVDVPGKCNTCYLIDREKGKATDKEVIRHLGIVHQLHRGGLFMLEREKYYKRVAYALANKDTVMSIIIDGMDQNHCRVPYLGSQNSFSTPLKQGITGIKEHGVGFFVYRTFGTVTKGTQFTLYCILTQLQLWLLRHKCFPEELLIQVDGGSENANKLVLTMLELIVTKRMVRKIQFTRLPVGHTHEDIDACFAIIWSLSRHESCLTLDEYKDRIVKHLKNTKIPTSFHDVYVIPDYGPLLSQCTDQHLQLLHKWPYTQHCWRFEAVKPSEHFPFGCKTTYKAYCSDKVVEIQNKVKSQCYSLVGQFTGLEPVTVYCPWYPKKNGIEGTYLLRRLPTIFATSVELQSIPPVEFDEKKVKNILECLLEVKRKFVGVNEIELAWWIEWEKLHVPVLTSAADYVRKLKELGKGYLTPLAGYLFGQLKPVDALWRTKLTINTSDSNQDFQWPEVLALATQSVVTDFELHAPEPRVVMVNQNDLLDTLAEVRVKVDAYYASIATSYRKDAIILKLNQKVDASGHTMGTSKTKPALIDMWKQHDRSLLEAIFCKLSPQQLSIVEPLCLQNHPDLDTLIVSQRNNISFNRLILKEINGEIPFNAKGMNSILKLFRVRNEIAVRNNNSSFVPSLFIDVETSTAIMNKILDGDPTDILSIDPQFGNLTPSYVRKLCRIYLPYLHSGNIWGMIIIDFKLMTLYYVCHANHNEIQDFDPALDNLLEQISRQFSALLIEIGYGRVDNRGFEEWDISLYPLNGSSCSDEFSGIFVATTLYLLVHECPVYIPLNQLSNLRQKFTYWTICGALPM